MTYSKGNALTASDYNSLAGNTYPGAVNLYMSSSSFNDSNWTKNNTTVATSVAAPDGTNTACSVTTTAGAGSFINQSISLTASRTYTRSIYAKYVSGQGMLFMELIIGGAWYYSAFNLTTGVASGSVPSSIGYVTMSPVGGGWYRCTQTFFASSTTTCNAIYFDNYGNATTTTVISIWGAQLEVGVQVTDYIATTTFGPEVARTVGNLWGVGYGDRGYGETSPSFVKKDKNELMLECRSIDATGANGDGGFIFQRACPDSTQAYRFSQWVYTNKSSAGLIYMGTEGYNVRNLDGTTHTNPYWLYSKMDGTYGNGYTNNNAGIVTANRNPGPGEWFLFVGVLQGCNYTGTGFGSGISGIYDAAGNQIVVVPDYKLPVGATTMTYRTFLYYCNDAAQRVYIARPRLEKMSGAEPSIAQLIAMGSTAQPADTLINPSVWKLGNTDTTGWVNPSGAGQGWSQNGANEFTVVQSSVLAGTGSPVSQVISSTDWSSLRTAVNNMATWQGISTSLIPISSEFSNYPVKAESSNTTTNTYRVISYGSNAATGLFPGVYNSSGTLIGSYARSYMVTVFNRSTGALSSHKTYDVYGTAGADVTMANDLNALGSNSIVVVWTHDEPMANRTATLLNALYRCGATSAVIASSSFQYRGAYVLIGVPGCGTGNGFEAYAGNASASTTSIIDLYFTIKNGQFWVRRQNNGYAYNSILTKTSGYLTDLSPYNTYSTYDLLDALNVIDSNRFAYNPANMTLTTSAASTTRSTTWGSGSTGITCEFSVTFTSEDAARFFFNTGGEIRITLNHTDTTTARNSSWNTTINNLTVAFRANGTARIGGLYGLPTNTGGYYGLTTTYQTILDGSNIGTSSYSVNDFYIDAKASTITGSNGAKGSVIYFRVRLIDEQANPSTDTVAAGTMATLSHLRATGSPLTAKPAPSCTVVTSF